MCPNNTPDGAAQAAPCRPVLHAGTAASQLPGCCPSNLALAVIMVRGLARCSAKCRAHLDSVQAVVCHVHAEEHAAASAPPQVLDHHVLVDKGAPPQLGQLQAGGLSAGDTASPLRLRAEALWQPSVLENTYFHERHSSSQAFKVALRIVLGMGIVGLTTRAHTHTRTHSAVLCCAAEQHPMSCSQQPLLCMCCRGGFHS